MLIQENIRKLLKLEDSFCQVIRKTKVNVNFLFKLRFQLDRVEKKQQKIKLKNFVHFPRISCIVILKQITFPFET